MHDRGRNNAAQLARVARQVAPCGRLPYARRFASKPAEAEPRSHTALRLGDPEVGSMCTRTGLDCRMAQSAIVGGSAMPESVYKIIEIVGTSTTSWEKAASAAVEKASQTLRDLRIAEVTQQDIVINDGKIESYRVRLKVSFKYED
jgi:dodecin